MKALAFLFLMLTACTSGEKTLIFECEEQRQGEACNKLGKAREGAEAQRYFEKGCGLGNTNSCVSLAAVLANTNPQEAVRVLKQACDKGNMHACTKYAELTVKSAQPKDPPADP